MSESAAKASRRALRRAVGDATASALVEQSRLTARHDLLIANLTDRWRRESASLAAAHERLMKQENALDLFRSMSIGQRLRWIITGRS